MSRFSDPAKKYMYAVHGYVQVLDCVASDLLPLCVCVLFCVSVGAASLSCAETLRQENFGGRIIMVTREDLLPYDKTRLSKVQHSE